MNTAMWLWLVALVLGLAAGRELVGDLGAKTPGRPSPARSVPHHEWLGPISRLLPAHRTDRLRRRIRSAGLGDRLAPFHVLTLKLGLVPLGGLLGLSVAPSAPPRIALLLPVGLAVAAFLAPDAFLERRARMRREAVLASLPDLLSLLAVAAGAGREPVGFLAETGSRFEGVLGEECALLAAELASGTARAQALEAMSERLPGAGLGPVVSAVGRSARFGTPLANQLAAQAAGLRAEQARRVEERAQRAAPKIQLVVALVLVPGVLLMVGAVLLTNTDALLGV